MLAFIIKISQLCCNLHAGGGAAHHHFERGLRLWSTHCTAHLGAGDAAEAKQGTFKKLLLVKRFYDNVLLDMFT